MKYSMASVSLSLLSLVSLLIASASSSPPAAATRGVAASSAITLSLSPRTKAPFPNPWQRLNRLAASSITRARHLKTSHKNSSSSSSPTKTPLFPHSYGGYSISLSFGTPAQTLPFLMDTGSSLVWFPCTKRYFCSKCNFSSVNPERIPTFIPKLSSSGKILGCKNPKCGLVFGSEVRSQCRDCDEISGNCNQTCPPYMVQYGSGATTGLLLSETLEFPNKSVKDFVVGCSVFSTRQPCGIAGFGRGPESLPAQMGLGKFSYCLVSHRFDEMPESSDLVLVDGLDSGHIKTGGLSYTPFLNNTKTKNFAFLDFYYVNLKKITVGGKNVKAPYSYLVPRDDGNGGTIVDSGTTFTFMESKVFELVAKEFEQQMANHSRASEAESQSGLRPCFNFTAGKTVLLFPELVFHFKGGGKMELPLANYFSFVGDSSVCMTIVTDTVVNPVAAGGPSIILGNYQQQNFYIEYDLRNQRLGFRKQVCK
ncbi:probable aspartyl protease At4g16563 [Diospyros lotus]|uniref:probable aspartyl protease At4g16563 n=1 Tax=Diospyros lotus TaxID=55363 RepID=UPI0022534391|nr:probable aspartyl protease At4g16563 [Diospyros lotus]